MTTVVSAEDRAEVALAIIRSVNRYDQCGKRLDDCFEGGDGSEVYRIILGKIRGDAQLADHLRQIGLRSWVNEAGILGADSLVPVHLPDACEIYPLNDGDRFEIHSCQVRGLYDNHPHYAVPGQYVVVSAGPVVVHLRGPSGIFRCSRPDLLAVLGEWSNYQAGERL